MAWYQWLLLQLRLQTKIMLLLNTKQNGLLALFLCLCAIDNHNSRHWEDVLETSIIPVTDVYKPSLHHSHIEHLIRYTYLRERSVPGFCVTMKEVCAPKCKTSCNVNFAPSLNKHCKSMAKCLNQNQKRYQCSCYQNETMHKTVFLFSTYIFITQLTYLVTLF